MSLDIDASSMIGSYTERFTVPWKLGLEVPEEVAPGGKQVHKRYTEEFKWDAIALVDSSGKTVTAVARELGISSESLRGWYRKVKAGQGEGAPGEVSSAEREEL
ncbi:transposase [Streptomyces niveus]|uniref:Transposase n=1 Tax=Streptomyces niveus TaxID=193462 RepID=A0ABZ1ZZY6_STRNV|nr:transposase [Streptomyces niveus]